MPHDVFKNGYEGDKLPKNRLTGKMFGQWCFTLICPVKLDIAFIREFNNVCGGKTKGGIDKKIHADHNQEISKSDLL